ncbi:hypothetical protein GRF59_18585 [Paenibacillus sp. HJL G12]|uniref:Uncharacterized protein n=1 Tax=Paenibacillus dendrobii TaxID=2691084 RepID=A0A7X3IKJ0_9BACL|nr:hypothetical protein [Paenibacillus dendrobii]MWV45624.1 hypothetical protein [Paenibacillus dendrobii]
MIKRVAMTGLIANAVVMPQALASGTSVSGAQAAHGTWYWLAYSAAILLFGFAIYIMSGARMKRRVSMLRVALQSELDIVDGLLSDNENASNWTEPRAGYEQESLHLELTELRNRLNADLKELNRKDVSVFNLVGLSSIAKRFTAEKRAIRAQLRTQA